MKTGNDDDDDDGREPSDKEILVVPAIYAPISATYLKGGKWSKTDSVNLELSIFALVAWG